MQHGVSSEASPLIPEPSSTVQTNNNNNNNTGDNTSSVEALQTARRLLYTSHCSAQFSEQTWQFSLLLFLTALTNYSSVFLVSSYGLVSGLVVCLAGPAAGRFFVDNKLRRCDRLTAAQFLIGSQNMSVLLATACCYFLLLASQQQQSDEEGMQKAFEKNHDETTLLAWVESTLQGVPLDYSSVWLIVGVHIFGSLAQILDTAFLVTIERDWVVVMHNVSTFVASVNTDGSEDGIGNGSQTIHHSSGSGVSWLAETNVVMKQIDLSCKVAAPAIAGFFIGAAKAAPAGATSHQQQQYPNDNGAYDLATAALIVGMINAMSLMVEYLCTARIYELVPALRVQTLEHPAPPSTPMLLSVQLLCGGNNTTETKVIAANAVIVDDTTGNNDNGHGVNRTQTAVPLDAQCGFFGAHLLPSGLQTFMNQRISWAGLGLAMLYLNALTFGSLMTAYLVWRGMRLQTVGWWRGASAAIGLAGTVVYKWLTVQRKCSLVTTGMWSILFQLVCITVAFVSLFVLTAPQFYNFSMALLIGGVCLSRIGLWVFDMTVTQLQQEFIPDGVRGVVGGTQHALNAFFQLSSFGLCLLVPDPRDFPMTVTFGYVAVCLSAISYYVGVYLRKHEFDVSLD